VACPFDAIVEARKGFTVLAGGREGKDIRLGEKIAEFLSEEEVFQVIGRGLEALKKKNANATTIIDEIGIEKFKEMLVPSVK
jgi:dissimilatory sulfite reductase (desulfoviridin) alpha/beta subunit